MERIQVYLREYNIDTSLVDTEYKKLYEAYIYLYELYEDHALSKEIDVICIPSLKRLPVSRLLFENISNTTEVLSIDDFKSIVEMSLILEELYNRILNAIHSDSDELYKQNLINEHIRIVSGLCGGLFQTDSDKIDHCMVPEDKFNNFLMFMSDYI